LYSRADLSRTVAIVVALFLTAISTSAVARKFHAAYIQSEDYPTVQALRYSMVAERSGRRHQIRAFHSRQRARAAGVTIVTDFDRTPLEAAMAGIHAKAQRDRAAAELIERIRKVE
jgi:TRAP-type C4-dicarboxylate transport system substrate-binding protein